MKKFFIGLILGISLSVHAQDYAQTEFPPVEDKENELAYFVSFSIPEKQLVTLIRAAEHQKIPVYIRGLIHNDMKRTAKAILYLAQKYNVQGMLVDPLRFEHYDIQAVPALVKKCGQKFDVIYGNVDLKQALDLIANQGECK
ncbi:hypothetical protein HEMROJRC1_20740 [Rodentibacter sp. JRC1]|uniref:type-F conjugative transfer system pilin assembly protein TrbC n=1 Tax=Rodentibacter sp. JRC1 TaxID=2874504 RepID=UPI001CFCC196|nr:type-F conjugative transfer system pilin assembly protein TrbC [Rodentibacter sp. JRC1]GJI56962.1 hypothetical protein HEMROJRC1_20740 [Rodentibacter sp. JRC1]